MTDQQVRKMMAEYQKSGDLSIAAARSGMHRETAAKYRRLKKLPSELKKPRTWRTRKDPFQSDSPATELTSYCPTLRCMGRPR